jgi:hypothetical protein
MSKKKEVGFLRLPCGLLMILLLIIQMLQSKYGLSQPKQSANLCFSVVIATGLLSLVDDSIKTKWRSSESSVKTLLLPVNALQMSPKHFIDQLFNPYGRHINFFRMK